MVTCVEVGSEGQGIRLLDNCTSLECKRYEGNPRPLAVGRAVSNLGNAYQAMGKLSKAKECYEIALGHAIYGNDLRGQGRACGNIGNIYMLLKEPVKAVHYYTETLHLSTDNL